MAYPEKRQVTEKRLAANRAAARKSTGPRTAQGKQRSAFNSFQHGGFTRHEHLWRQALERSGDDPHALDRLRQPLLADWQPATAQQQLLIDDLAWLYWLRDRTRLAFLHLQARRLPQAQLDRAVELGLREAARLELEEGEAGAVAQPVEPGEIVDEQLLLGGGGLPVGEQWLAEAVEGVGIIAGTLQGLAPEMFVAGEAAVLEGVEGGTLFALGGARAGGFAGGGAIGGQAFFGHLTFFRIGHGSCSLGF